MNRVLLTLALLLTAAGFACNHMPAKSKSEQAADIVHDARALLNSQRYRDALSELLRAEQMDERSAQVQVLLADAYFSGFQLHNEATLHAQKAIALSPDGHLEAENLLGLILFDQERFAEAIPYFERGAKGAWPIAEQNLGEAYWQLGEPQKAATHLQNALRAGSADCGAYLPLAQSLRALGRPVEAEAQLGAYRRKCEVGRLQKRVPLSMTARVYFELGMAQLDQKNKKKARETFATCSERFSDEEGGQKCLLALKRL